LPEYRRERVFGSPGVQPLGRAAMGGCDGRENRHDDDHARRRCSMHAAIVCARPAFRDVERASVLRKIDARSISRECCYAR
jgi:hypothetical protein